MKKTRIFLIMLLVGAALVSCSKKPGENFAQVITPESDGIIMIEGANNGGNITCDEVAEAYGCDFDQSSGRMDFDGGDGGTYGPITWTTDGTYVNWTSTVPVKIAIIVKGGPDASVYFSGCDEYLMEGTGLTPPVNPNNGKFYGLSNITFCFTKIELVVALKSYMNSGWAVTEGDDDYFVGDKPFIIGAVYPLYRYGNTDEHVGNLEIGNFDTDEEMEVKITSIDDDLKFTEPYLFVGTLDDYTGLWYGDYPYPEPKYTLDPPGLSEIIIDLPF